MYVGFLRLWLTLNINNTVYYGILNKRMGNKDMSLIFIMYAGIACKDNLGCHYSQSVPYMQ